MPLLVGTHDGVYRTPDLSFETATRTLDAGRVLRVEQFPNVPGVFACSAGGLFRSTDAGRSWDRLSVPREEVYSACGTPDGDRLLAGTHPAHLYASADGGETWTELEGFQELPSRERWHTPRHRNEAHVRSLGVHAAAPDRVVAGVEVGGVHVSEDGGDTWEERRDGVHDDVHHVLVCGPAAYVAACGDGLYRTTDAGHTWTRLDEDRTHRYFRESVAVNGSLYTAAARGPPGTWRGESGADGVVLQSESDGASFASIEVPGAPEEVILAWTVVDGVPVGGSNAGRVVVETPDGWETAGRVPHGIRALCRV